MSRLFITTPTKIVNVSNVIFVIDSIFTQYAILLDQSQHFNIQKVRKFFWSQNVSLTFNPTRASQSTGIIEINNRLLENVLRKADIDWKMVLNRSTKNLNGHVIQHLEIVPLNILLGVIGTSSAINCTLRLVGS